MFDYFYKEADSFSEVEQKISKEAPPKSRAAHRKRWFINTLGSIYQSRLKSMGWYSDFQKISAHFREEVARNAGDKDNFRNIFASILHPGHNRCFNVPDETASMLNRLTDTRINIQLYPRYSAYLEFGFTLAKPYISKDDSEFYIEENPIRKDKVFKVPMISPSGWKGNLRCAVRQAAEIDNDEDSRVIALFGNPRKSESDFKKGRLTFYPTFLNQISLEVFNPHRREKRAGKQPIFFESIPQGAKGTFQLFYLPFDLVGSGCNDETARDLSLIYEGINQMFLTSGFSAKRSLDYGIAERSIDGTFEMSGFALFKSNPIPKQRISGAHPFAKLASLKLNTPPEKIKDNGFSSFEELKSLMERVQAEVFKNG